MLYMCFCSSESLLSYIRSYRSHGTYLLASIKEQISRGKHIKYYVEKSL